MDLLTKIRQALVFYGGKPGLLSGGYVTRSSTNLLYAPDVSDKVYLYENSLWVEHTIPDSGITVACTGLTSDTAYYLYVYDNAGTLTLDLSTTVPTTQDGIGVKTGATDRLMVARCYAKAPAMTQITIAFADNDPDEITDSRSNFVNAGFEAGMSVTVSGSTDNDDTYLIDTVAAGTLTLDAGEALTAEAAGDTVTLTATTGAISTVGEFTNFQLICNEYNRREYKLIKIEATDSWTVNSATWDEVNDDPLNRVCFVASGKDGCTAQAQIYGLSVSGPNNNFGIGIDLDGVSANDAQLGHHGYVSSGSRYGELVVFIGTAATITAGYHFLQWVEKTVNADQACTLSGPGSATGMPGQNSGIIAEIMA